MRIKPKARDTRASIKIRALLFLDILQRVLRNGATDHVLHIAFGKYA